MMNNEEINRLIQELEKLKTPEQEGIETPGCEWGFNIIGETLENELKNINLKYGYKRQTKEACELAAKRMIRTNRLSLLAHILGVEREFVEDKFNYYVIKTVSSGLWKSNGNISLYYPDRVYMTKEGAESVCTILNNGEWSLEINDE